MKKGFLLSFVLILCLLVAPFGDSVAQVPKTLNYQGLLNDENGIALDRTVPVEFKIFESENGGQPVWVEIQDVTADNGFVNVYLGTINPLNIDFNRQYWLEIKVGNGTPFSRTRFTSVPSAVSSARSEKADIASAVTDNAVGTKGIRDAAVTQDKLASGIKALPDGPAGGDLAGDYPDPVLAPGAAIRNIEPGTITQDKLAPNVTTPPSGPASGDLTGTYPDPLIAVGAVKTDRIADRAVTGMKIAEDAVGEFQLAETGVYAGTYGDMYNVASFNVDEDGRLHYAENVLIHAMDDGVNSDIDVYGTEINNLDLQINPETVGAVELSPTSVTAGDYGDMYHVGSFTVDEDGRLTMAADVLIMANDDNTNSDINVNMGEINSLDLQLNDDVVGVPEINAYRESDGMKPVDATSNGSFIYYSYDAQSPEAMNWSAAGVDGYSPVWDAGTGEFVWGVPTVSTIAPILGNGSMDNPIHLDTSATFVNDWEMLYFNGTSWVANLITPPNLMTNNAADGSTDGHVLTWNNALGTMTWAVPEAIVYTASPVVGDGSAADPVTLNSSATFVNDNEILYFNTGAGGWVAGPVTTDLIGDNQITTDKLADASVLGQVMYYDGVDNWDYSGGLSPTTPTFTYVLKWMDDGSTGFADWAKDGLTIPWAYDGVTDGAGATAFSLTINEDGADVAHFEHTTTGNAVTAMVPNDNSAGSAIVASGGGSDMPTVSITRTTDNSLANGALLVDADLTTLESASPAVKVDMTVTGDDGYNSYGIWANNSVPGATVAQYAGWFNVDAGTFGTAVAANGNGGMAIAGEAAPTDPSSYVASITRTAGSAGRAMYVEGDSFNPTPLFQDPADEDDAVLVVRNLNSQAAPFATAIKAYGDIWANSAVGANMLIGLQEVYIGDPNGLHTLLTPPAAPGAPLLFSTGIYVDGDVETTGIFIGDGAGLFNIAESNTTAANEAEDAVMFYNGTDWEWSVAPTVNRTALVWENGSLTWTTIEVSFADITSGINTSATMVVADDAMLIPANPVDHPGHTPGVIEANEWTYDVLFDAQDLDVENGEFDLLQVNNYLTVSDGGGAAGALIENLNVDGNLVVSDPYAFGSSADFFLPVNINAPGNLNVDVAATFAGLTEIEVGGTLQVDGTLDVNGAATFASTTEFEAGSATTFNGSADFNDATNLNGATDLTGTFALDGVEGADNEVMVGTGIGNTPIWTLSLDGLTLVETVDLDADNAVINTNLDVNGDAQFAQTLLVEATGNLDVDGTTDFSDNVVVSGGTLDVNVDATFAAVTEFEAGSATTFNGTADFNDATNLNGATDLTGTFALDGVEGATDEVMVGMGAGNTPIWTLELDNLLLVETVDLDADNAVINTMLDVNGDADFAAGMTATFNGNTLLVGATDLQGTFELDGVEGADNEVMVGVGIGGTPVWTLTLDGLDAVETVDLDADNAIVNTTLDVDGTSDFSDVVVISGGSLDVNVDATFAATTEFEVGSTTNFNGAANLNGATDLTGTFALDGLEGATDEVMVGMGAGNTPIWTLTLDNLDLVATDNLTANSATINTALVVDGDATFNAGSDFTGTFSLDGVEGTLDYLMVGMGAGNTPMWTNDLSVNNLTVGGDFIANGSSTMGETYFEGDVTIGDGSTSYSLTINGYGVATLGSNTFTALNLFGVNPSADPIPAGTILAAVSDDATDPTVVFQNTNTGAVLQLRGVEAETAFEVSNGDAQFNGPVNINHAPLNDYQPGSALEVSSSGPIADAAMYVGNFYSTGIYSGSYDDDQFKPAILAENINTDGIAIRMRQGGFQMSATYAQIPANTNIDCSGDYTVWSVTPLGVNASMSLPSDGVEVGQIIYILNNSGANTVTVNGGAFVVAVNTTATFIRVQTDNVGTLGWRRLN